MLIGTCPNCDGTGMIGNSCAACENNMVYMASQASTNSSSNSSDTTLGECFQCGNLVIIGNYCIKCEDSNMIYERPIHYYDNDTGEHRFHRSGESSGYTHKPSSHSDGYNDSPEESPGAITDRGFYQETLPDAPDIGGYDSKGNMVLTGSIHDPPFAAFERHVINTANYVNTKYDDQMIKAIIGENNDYDADNRDIPQQVN